MRPITDLKPDLAPVWRHWLGLRQPTQPQQPSACMPRNGFLFEISYPWQFVLIMKLVRLMPYPLFFRLIKMLKT